jgi:hypothetical protein
MNRSLIVRGLVRVERLGLVLEDRRGVAAVDEELRAELLRRQAAGDRERVLADRGGAHDAAGDREDPLVEDPVLRQWLAAEHPRRHAVVVAVSRWRP